MRRINWCFLSISCPLWD